MKYSKLILVVGSVTLVSVPFAEADEHQDKMLANLQGEWKIVGCVRGDAKEPAFGSLSIKGESYRCDECFPSNGRIAISKSSPDSCTFIPDQGNFQLKTRFKVQGDELKIAMLTTLKRPKSLTEVPKKGELMVYTFVRKTKADLFRDQLVRSTEELACSVCGALENVLGKDQMDLRIRSIIVIGNETVSDAEIRHHLQLYPGQKIRNSELIAAEARLAFSGKFYVDLFRRPRVTVVDDTESRFRDVVVRVREPANAFKAGR